MEAGAGVIDHSEAIQPRELAERSPCVSYLWECLAINSMFPTSACPQDNSLSNVVFAVIMEMQERSFSTAARGPCLAKREVSGRSFPLASR
jgi:hypothetical protein